ncbi:MAG: DEAD/DEAH box helicase family protein [Bacteroidales bacterium]|nr:DEAD/DEAH box helicase family protein [Bacteroidales bacterium]
MTIKVETRPSQKCNGECSIFVSFQYDYHIIQTIKEFPQRYYEPSTREWELPIYKLAELQQKLPEFRFEIVDNKSILEKDKTPIITNFAFKTKPYKHQLECFNYGMKYDKFLLADEMGLGKTKESVDIAVAKKQQNGYTHCLIICGVNSLKWNWVNEVNTHSNESAWILGQRKLRNGKTRVGSNKDKLEDLYNLDLLNHYFIITNIETLRDTAIQTKMVELFKAKKIQMIVADEVHKCFDYDTLVVTNKGEVKIGDIVTGKICIDSVLSYNIQTGEREWKPIKRMFENTTMQKFLILRVETKEGIKTVKCTDEHKFYTKNRGWVCAKDLTENDEIEEF